ncbi:MAG: hypothetical protein IT165_23475 [Bryobacterales bacterium]|nr:hypothetical protein [Bryobacterales bacterium]
MLFATMAVCALAQQPTVIIQVDYMKVAPGKAADYRKAEEAVKTSVHQDRVKKGMILSWSLYAVRFPAGAAREYDFATVTAYPDMGKLETPYDEEQLKRMRDTGVGPLRTLLRADVLAVFATAGEMGASWPWVTVNYIKAKPGMLADWRRDEMEAWKPIAEAQIKAGALKGWVAQTVVWPAGTSRAYDLVSVNGRETFTVKQTPGIGAMVSSAASRSEKHGETIRREMWRLVSRTDPR